jgi:hypothetical protein
LVGPRSDRDARLIVHVGKKVPKMFIGSKSPGMRILSGCHEISPQVRKPKKVRKKARVKDRL